MRIANEILMFIRSAKKFTNQQYLQEPIGVDKEGNEITLQDKVADSGDCIEEQVDLKLQIVSLYNEMKKVLLKRERLVLELRYGLSDGNEKTQREIAAMLGISRSYVSRIEKKALQKLMKAMKDFK